jgi:hypothetical protein
MYKLHLQGAFYIAAGQSYTQRRVSVFTKTVNNPVKFGA